MRIFAIGFKDWIEFRASKTPPIEEVTEARIPPRSRLYKSKLKIKVVHHKGGKVIKTIKGNQIAWYYWTENYFPTIFVGDGQMVEMPADIAKKILEKVNAEHSV
jgi:hypothetical protein